MKKIFTIVFCLFTVSRLSAQTCSSCINFIGDEAHGFKQILLDTKGAFASDTSQPEIPAAAWTCNSAGFPTCNARGLFKFDIASIPAEAVITSAKLYLYSNPGNINGQPENPMFGTNNTALLQKVTASWSVANTGWNNQPATTTNDQKVLPQSTSNIQNYTLEVKDFVQFWVNKPDSNYGMLLRLQSEQYYNSMIFYSGKAANDSLKPRLEICYSIPSTVQLTLRGDTAGNTFKQLLLDTKSAMTSDTTQPEIASSAWTCNSLGFPTCNTRGLFKYNIAQIPPGATINSAQLFLFANPGNLNGQTGNPMFGDNNASLLQKVTTAWTLANTGWSNQPAATTANQKTLAQSTSNIQNYTIDITDFVQFWVNKPDSNYGMLLKLQNEQYYNSMVFYSGKVANPELKPRLEICYTAGSVLPLSLSDFMVTGNALSNTLQWTINNQQDLLKIEIERSLNGTGFKTINTIAVSGTAYRNTYKTTDADIANQEKMFYRLKMVKKNGSMEYSKILLISHANSSDFKVFPNPAKSYTQVSFKSADETKTTIKVLSVAGQTFYKQNITLRKGYNSISIPQLDKLQPGVYIITMAVNNIIVHQKLIVQ